MIMNWIKKLFTEEVKEKTESKLRREEAESILYMVLRLCQDVGKRDKVVSTYQIYNHRYKIDKRSIEMVTESAVSKFGYPYEDYPNWKYKVVNSNEIQHYLFRACVWYKHEKVLIFDGSDIRRFDDTDRIWVDAIKNAYAEYKALAV